MYNLITERFQGVSISVAVTGVPVLISGEVIGGDGNTIALRKKDGSIVNIAADLIAFFF